MVPGQRNLLERKVPVDLINEEARIEKLGTAKPPISEMHYFFTRKPLITSRFIIAGAALDAKTIKHVEEINRLLGIDPRSKRRAFRVVPLDLVNKIKAQHPEGLVMLDPFAGSGMIPFEALRLGLDVVAIDYNAVAYIIMKGTLEFPLKYGGAIDENTGKSKLLTDVKRYFDEVFSRLREELSEFYPNHGDRHVLAYMFAWEVACPTCGRFTPLVNNWWLDRKNGVRLDYQVKNGKLEYSIVKDKDAKEGNAQAGHATCLYCAAKITNDWMISDISNNEREVVLAVYLDDRSFELPTPEDINALDRAKNYIRDHSSSLAQFVPTEALPDDLRAVPAKKYLAYWNKLFNSRQLLILSSYARESRRIVEDISKQDREYASAIGTYLSMILAKHVVRNNRGTCWDNSLKVICHSLTNRGINMMWNHAEPNPFMKFSGSLLTNVDGVLKGLAFAIEELNKNSLDSFRKPKLELIHASILSWQPEKKFKFIITDPPYYDDVPYPELMQFFQVWHYRVIGDLFSITATPPVSEELSVGGDRDEVTFEKRLLIAIKKLYDALDVDGVLVMFYAHGSIEGWKYVLEALRKTGFHVTSTITLMTESKDNVIARGKSSVFHSLVITARKREGKKTATMIDVEEEIRRKIEHDYCDLEKTYGKDRMNLMVAASGMVIETITAYSDITSFTRNTAEYALEIGQRFLIEAFAKRTLNVDHADPKTMIYTWFRHSRQDYIDFSEFNQTLKALGSGEESVADIIERAKDDRSRVRLLDFSERGALEIDGMEPLMAQSIIDAVHVALRAYIRGGVTAAKDSVDSSPFGRKVILNTMDALSNVYATKGNYREGEISKKFLEEWTTLYGGEQRTLK